ncbi:MAG: hypothetical protein ACOCUL_04705 [Bacteroidota bacterium]
MMKNDIVAQLSFGSINKLKYNIHELVISHIPSGEIEIDHIVELESSFSGKNIPCYLMIIKKTPFSYSFSALMKIREQKLFNGIAVVGQSKLNRIDQNIFESALFKNLINIKYFSCRQQALDWLDELRVNSGEKIDHS